jgi:hypothetical protein
VAKIAPANFVGRSTFTGAWINHHASSDAMDDLLVGSASGFHHIIFNTCFLILGDRF